MISRTYKFSFLLVPLLSAGVLAGCSHDPLAKEEEDAGEPPPELVLTNVKYRYYEGNDLSISGTAESIGYSNSNGALLADRLWAMFHGSTDDEDGEDVDSAEKGTDSGQPSREAKPSGKGGASGKPGKGKGGKPDGKSAAADKPDKSKSKDKGDAAGDDNGKPEDMTDDKPMEAAGVQVLNVVRSFVHDPELWGGVSCQDCLASYLDSGVCREGEDELHSIDTPDRSGKVKDLAHGTGDIYASTQHVQGNLVIRWVDAMGGVEMKDINGTRAITERASFDAKGQRLFGETPVDVTGRGLVATAKSGFILPLRGDRVLHFQGPIESRIFPVNDDADGKSKPKGRDKPKKGSGRRPAKDSGPSPR